MSSSQFSPIETLRSVLRFEPFERDPMMRRPGLGASVMDRSDVERTLALAGADWRGPRPRPRVGPRNPGVLVNVQGAERLEVLRRRLEAGGRVVIADVAAELDVSDMTIRRDPRGAG